MTTFNSSELLAAEKNRYEKESQNIQYYLKLFEKDRKW